jgi:hypothetical protein
MQKVEGSSPFSRFKSPAKAGFFVGGGSRQCDCHDAEGRRFEPGQWLRECPDLLAFRPLGRPSPRPDGHLLESVPDSFRKLEPEAVSSLHARRGSRTRHASSRTSLTPFPTGIDEARSHEPKSAATVPISSLAHAAAGLRTLGLLLIQDNGRRTVVGSGCWFRSSHPDGCFGAWFDRPRVVGGQMSRR